LFAFLIIRGGAHPMGDEDKEETRGPGLFAELPTTLLSQIPPVNPAIIRAMEKTRLSDRHFSAIGNVAGWWAYFELLIDTWLWDFAGVDEKIGVCFTGQMIGPRPRLDAFISLVRHLGCKAQWNTILEELAKDATGLAEQRNRAVHDVWYVTDPTQPHRQEATAKRSVRLLKVHVPTDELDRLVDNINRLINRFDDIASDIQVELASQGKLPSSVKHD
jgi:hypothetical protein